MAYNIPEQNDKSKYTTFLEDRNIEIYLQYTGLKGTPKKTVIELAEKHNLSRARIYGIIDSVKRKLLRGQLSL